MNYTKPEIVEVGSALRAVASIGQVKGPDANLDAAHQQTGSAYEADE